MFTALAMLRHEEPLSLFFGIFWLIVAVVIFLFIVTKLGLEFVYKRRAEKALEVSPAQEPAPHDQEESDDER